MSTVRIMTAHKFDTKSSPSAGLRSPGWLAKWPMIGLAMVLVGSLAFGAIAMNVKAHGPLLQWDVPLYKQLYGDAAKEPPSDR